MGYTVPPSGIAVSQADDDNGIDDSHYPKIGSDQSNQEITYSTSTPRRMRSSYKCLECTKTFFTRSELRRHISEDIFNLFECDKCTKRFNDKSQLKRHESSHNSSKWNSFVCNSCDKSFGRYNQLVRHGLECNFEMFITRLN